MLNLMTVTFGSIPTPYVLVKAPVFATWGVQILVTNWEVSPTAMFWLKGQSALLNIEAYSVTILEVSQTVCFWLYRHGAGEHDSHIG